MHFSPNRRVRAAVALAGAAMALLVAVGWLPTPGSVAGQGATPVALAMSLAAVAGAVACLAVALAATRALALGGAVRRAVGERGRPPASDHTHQGGGLPRPRSALQGRGEGARLAKL